MITPSSGEGMKKSVEVKKVSTLDGAQKRDIGSLHDGLHSHAFGESHGNAEFKESDYQGEKAAMFTADDGKGFLALKITDDGVAVIEHLRFEDPAMISGLLQQAKAHLRDRKGVSEILISISEELRDIEHIIKECGFDSEGESGEMRTLRARL